MKNLLSRDINQFRVFVEYFDDIGDDTCGAFVTKSPIDNQPLHIIASSGLRWDHVSVSRKNRPPNWTEMDYVKRLFFEDHECAMQLHVPISEHININPNTLHLWRPHYVEIPMPPPICV